MNAVHISLVSAFLLLPSSAKPLSSRKTYLVLSVFSVCVYAIYPPLRTARESDNSHVDSFAETVVTSFVFNVSLKAAVKESKTLLL